MLKRKAERETAKTSVKQKALGPQDEGGQSNIDKQMPVEGSGVLPLGPSGTQQYLDMDMHPEVASSDGVELADPSYPQSELVKDSLSRDQHAQDLMPVFIPKTLCDRGYFIHRVADEYDQIDAKYRWMSSRPGLIEKLFEDNNWIIPIIDKCARDKSYAIIRRLKILRRGPPQTRASTSGGDNWESLVTLGSWKMEFKGKAADVLLNTISTYLCQKNVRVNHCSIVNSSGTGKSRMVDELATRIITVPMCLRKSGSQGFPPPDEELRNWLLSLQENDQGTISEKLYRFVYALLDVTLRRLKKIQDDRPDIKRLVDLIKVGPNGRSDYVIRRQEKLAASFRLLMSDYKEFGGVTPYRECFFREVVALANKLAEHEVEVLKEQIVGKSYNALKRQRIRCLFDAGKALEWFVDEYGVLTAKDWTESRRPLFVLSFDDSHDLTEVKQGQDWSTYVQLHQVLAALGGLPIFSLFLSTAGTFHIPSSVRLYPPSVLRDDETRVLPPIAETDFDQLALPTVEDVTTLSEVVTNRWMCHLGRPLFGSRYDAAEQSGIGLVRESIVSFAERKLLGGLTQLDELEHLGLSSTRLDSLDRTLACFSARIPLEFNFVYPYARHLVREQVENHMRLCTTVTSGFELLVTTVGSEPLLAEAAKNAMYRTGRSPVKQLLAFMDINCIDCGQRGELVAALLVMQARDAVARAKFTRSIHVLDFLETLLGIPCDTLHNALPSSLRAEGDHSVLAEAFKDARMWFNHALKVRNADVINTQYLWRFITRGAIMLCANSQNGVKNNAMFNDDIRGSLFEGMNPIDMEVFNGGTTRPVIRMVFALASERNAIKFAPPQQPSSSKYTPDNFTSYDIWCAGLSRETFAIIRDKDLLEYKSLLDRTRHTIQYDVTKAYRVRYPTEVAGQLSELRSHFDPLLESGPEHQSASYMPREGRTTGTRPSAA